MADGTVLQTSRATTRAGAANIDRILDVALSAFARDGLRGARLEAIAAAAAMSKPNLLYYFRSKEALYAAVLKRMLDIWLEPLATLDSAGDPAVALSNYIAQKLDHARRFPEASRLFALEVMQGAPVLGPVLKTELAVLVARTTKTLKTWIDAGKLAPIDPLRFIFLIWATTQHYADFDAQIRHLGGRGLGDPVFFETTKREVTALILRGAMPR